ncbi:MAG: hypothetical protein KF862_07130 [Chitinophagaceae bacterium]|nr:hypothetical protein [Chitinophagaceae bacterium]
MTDEQIADIIAYFENKELPATMQVQDGLITDCKEFVKTQKYRIREGVPVIARASYDHLVAFKEELVKAGL